MGKMKRTIVVPSYGKIAFTRVGRENLAKATTSPDILVQLMDDEDWLVRENVANNEHATPETLEHLAHDEYWCVRFVVAHHPKVTPEILAYLAGNDEPECTLDVVARHPSTPPEVRFRLFLEHPEWVR